jgi:transcriptional regulator with PAS, ATPase and Fis domain
MVEFRQQVKRLLEAERRIVDGELPTVLITGETGTGKELVARALHFDGPRRNKPFAELNCSAIPPHLIESELFGYERGAFTDARERKLGLIESAEGGTLFLDEIGDLEAGVQVKLLKLLEDRMVRRLGSIREQKVDVRFVAATNRPLEQLVRDGKFRSDLYFRLRIVSLDLPPLRNRGADILTLAEVFLGQHVRRYGKKINSFSQEARQALLAHTWPGNVRELRNVIEHAVLLSNSEVIEPRHLSIGDIAPVKLDDVPGQLKPANFPEYGGDQLEHVERDLIERALTRSGGNVTLAARSLGVSRDTLRYRLKKHPQALRN